MLRRLVCGSALLAGLTLAVGCNSSSSAPSKTPEQMKKEQEEMMNKMKPQSTTPPGTGK